MELEVDQLHNSLIFFHINPSLFLIGILPSEINKEEGHWVGANLILSAVHSENNVSQNVVKGDN